MFQRETARRAVVGVCLALWLAGCGASESDRVSLEGMAEDLWGRTIDLSTYDDGLTLIQPFSPANCGYCLVDGEFVEENYLHPNQERGGASFYQVLFNPQRDIYAYTKHYRDVETPVLTFPPELHRYHRNGFPALLAFEDGNLAYSGPLHPYEGIFQTLRTEFWPADPPSIQLAGLSHVANWFVFENRQAFAISVIPNGDEAAFEQAKTSSDGARDRSVIVKYEHDLETEDLQMNLYFQGPGPRFMLDCLRGQPTPLQIEPEEYRLGGYRFDRSTTALLSSFPNPHNPERYVVLRLADSTGALPPGKNYVDYSIHQRGDDDEMACLIEGLYKRAGGTGWAFADSLAFGSPGVGEFCVGSCPSPVTAGSQVVDRAPAVQIPIANASELGTVLTVGNKGAKFPSLAIGPKGESWVAWEEDGDILLASLGAGEEMTYATDSRHTARSPRTWAIEASQADSYDPVLTSDGSRLWIFYLCNRDGFYRLYARDFDGLRLSEESVISERGPFDVITPAATRQGETGLCVAWTEWKANHRYLRYREIEARHLGEIRTVAIAPNDIHYTNAWYADLTTDPDGQAWGAWNQHYPATLGVCSGNLIEPATSVTRLAESIEESENGGYPSALCDQDGRRWVFWESFGWDLAAGRAQKIFAATREAGGTGWSLPQTVSVESRTHFNQTPVAALDPGTGEILLAWSGRPKGEDGTWGVYLSRLGTEGWSAPRLISEKEETARAPRIVIGDDSKAWIGWHSGVGDEMQIKVLRVSTTRPIA